MGEAQLQREVCLEGILVKNEKIRFSVNDDLTWYTTTVNSVRGREIVIDFPEMFAAQEIILGDSISCRFESEKYMYSFQGKIEFIKIGFPQLIILQAVSPIEYVENNRQEARRDSLFLADLRIAGEDEVLHCCVRDVSTEGLRVVTKHELEEQQEIDIDIALPLRNVFDSLIKLSGKIMWMRVGQSHYEYGISIIKMDKDHRERLEHFLDLYER